MAIDRLDYEKLAEIRTQLLILRRTIPAMIKHGTMSPHEAAQRLRIWEGIEADYVERCTPAFVAA